MPDSLYQYLAPIAKAHPWTLWVLAVAFVLACLWSFTPHSWKVKVGAIPYGIGPRLVGMLDLASAISMFVLGKIWGVVVNQILKGQLVPKRIDRATAGELVGEALKQVPASVIVAMAHASTPPTVVIGDASKSMPRVPPMPMLTFALLALAGCGTPQHPSAALTEARVIAHDVARGYCALHTAATPMILVATAVYPAMSIPSHVADAFCATVAAVEADRDRAAHSVLVSGAEPFVAPEYALGVDGFTALTR